MILYQDDDWLVVDKPEGLATHAGKPGELGVVEWLALHHELETHVVSRLDRGTSGVLLLARSAGASARAQEIHESGEALKTYHFLTPDIPAGHWVCEDPLDGKEARTEFQALGTAGSLMTATGSRAVVRVEARITRGRRHQIRRHAAATGAPILGDRQYGGQDHGRLCLHCRQLRWPGIDMEPVSADPPSFAALKDGHDLGLALCQDRRLSWLETITNTFRALHRDEVPGLPAAIDVYGEFFDAIWFDEDADPNKALQRMKPALETMSRRYGCRGGVVRVHRRNPHQRSLVTETQVIGTPPPAVFQVQEHGLRYEINLLKTQHTGLFLDQRDTRRRVFQEAAGQRLANLFAYTCSFSLAAIAGGGEVAFSVDVARPGLNTGKRNFEHNGLAAEGRGKFVQEDVRRWLDRQLRRMTEKPDECAPLDLIVCDPPVFASSKKGGKFSVAKEWPRLAAAAARLLGDNGQALFANNHRSGDHAFYRRELENRFAQVMDLRPPFDFPVAAGRPHHVRLFWCHKTAR